MGHLFSLMKLAAKKLSSYDCGQKEKYTSSAKPAIIQGLLVRVLERINLQTQALPGRNLPSTKKKGRKGLIQWLKIIC